MQDVPSCTQTMSLVLTVCDGALATHSHKRCVDDLDSSFTREMVCYQFYRSTHIIISCISRTLPIALQFLSQLEWGARTSQS